jgi:hypothetical protein
MPRYVDRRTRPREFAVVLFVGVVVVGSIAFGVLLAFVIR